MKPKNIESDVRFKQLNIALDLYFWKDPPKPYQAEYLSEKVNFFYQDLLERYGKKTVLRALDGESIWL